MKTLWGRYSHLSLSRSALYSLERRKHNSGDLARPNPSEGKGVHKSPPPVVFAYTVYDAGRKFVDFYMTWRGKTVR
jgi:hypothetical protein